MRLLKAVLKKLILYPPIARRMIKVSLILHNKSYRLCGTLSSALELDGLHPKHRLMKYHEWFVKRLQKNWKVLDIGCGNGALAYDLRSNCAFVLGIDINPENIRIARTQFAREGINYVCGDAKQINFQEKFDAIVLSNLLEHFENRVEFLKRIYANQDAKNSPVLLLRVPMITRDWISMYKKEKGVEWRLDSSHFTEYTLEQLKDELDQAGLEIDSYDIQFGEFYGVLRKKRN